MTKQAEILALSKKLKPALRNRPDGFGSSAKLESYKRFQLVALFFLSTQTLGELLRLLKTNISVFQDIINNPEYNHYQIPKKKGGYREIYAPEKHLKRAQKILNFYLQGYYLWIKPDVAHGFVINPASGIDRFNIVSNAAVHLNKKHLLNIDIKDFFPSIRAKRVFELFKGEYFEFPDKIAVLLTLLSTYKGILPAGSPASPVISNLCCLNLDDELTNFCSANGFSYSRYADDLSFSTDVKITAEQIAAIKEIIRKHDFSVNENKVYLRSSSVRQTVTGITVNEKLNVKRELIKKTRAMLHDLKTNGLETATKNHFKLSSNATDKQKQLFINRLGGYINFIGQVRGKDDPLYRKMWNVFDWVFEE